MAKPKYRYGKEPRKGHYIGYYDEFINSPAFRSLSNAAVRVLILVRQRYKGSNNGCVSLSCREVERASPMNKSTANRAFKELIEKGFIKTKKQGYFTTGMATEWILTMEPLGDNHPTNDWKYWSPCKVSVPSKTHQVSQMGQGGAVPGHLEVQNRPF